jgi:hypothetical protein
MGATFEVPYNYGIVVESVARMLLHAFYVSMYKTVVWPSTLRSLKAPLGLYDMLSALCTYTLSNPTMTARPHTTTWLTPWPRDVNTPERKLKLT